MKIFELSAFYEIGFSCCKTALNHVIHSRKEKSPWRHSDVTNFDDSSQNCNFSSKPKIQFKSFTFFVVITASQENYQS